MAERDLDGQAIVVTGASRGIGAHVATALAARGAHVACVARTVAEGDHPLGGSLDETVAGIVAAGDRAVGIPVNLVDPDGPERIVAAARESLGRIDVLVNNAAVGFFGPLRDLSPSRWRVSWRINCDAVFELSLLVLGEMTERGSGRIVNISSNSAVGPGRGPYDPATAPVGDTAYGAQKAAVERLTQGLAEEVAPAGVGVAAVAPSQLVATPGAVLNGHVSGPDDPDAEPTDYMAQAIGLLITDPVERVAGRVVYSQQLLLEAGLIEAGAGLGVDPAVPVSGFTRR